MHDRLRVALRLHETHPDAAVWVTGTPAEVASAQRRLPHVCVEPFATNTAENAIYMLHALPVVTQEVWIVTSDWHMPRAQAIFAHTWRDRPWKRLFVSADHTDPRMAQRLNHLRSMEMVHASHWLADVAQAGAAALARS